MAINFIVNDPLAGPSAPAMAPRSPAAERPATRSGFNYSNTQAEGVAEPGTLQFLFWQAREAAILAVRAYESSAGAHALWQGNRRKIALRQDRGVDLNAYYDRLSFSFFHQTLGGKTYSSGASTDVVAHEVGHGLLDALRPDLFTANYFEVAAVHEAFGDCIAILTALADADTRDKLLALAPDLRKRNFVESTAEELSHAIGLLLPGHNASAPRRAFNTFKYQLPSTLPSHGGPGALINEIHSFGMVFSACFWDLIANLFAAGAQKDSAALLASARLAGRILIAGSKYAPVAPRFMQSVGRTMTLADQVMHGGANREHIRDAFARHAILLGTNAMLAPTALLAGAAPTAGKLSAATRKDLARRLGGAPGARLALQPDPLPGVRGVGAVQSRVVTLTGLHPLLQGVIALAQEPVVVGSSGGRAALLGALPNPLDTQAEVQAFVASLLAHRRIQLPGEAARSHPQHATHAVKTVGGKKVLTRVRFACACHPAAPSPAGRGTAAKA